MAELTIKHETKHIRNAPHAFSMGLAEGLGKGLGYAVAFGLLLWVIDHFNDDPAPKDAPASEQSNNPHRS